MLSCLATNLKMVAGSKLSIQSRTFSLKLDRLHIFKAKFA